MLNTTQMAVLPYVISPNYGQYLRHANNKYMNARMNERMRRDLFDLNIENCHTINWGPLVGTIATDEPTDGPLLIARTHRHKHAHKHTHSNIHTQHNIHKHKVFLLNTHCLTDS